MLRPYGYLISKNRRQIALVLESPRTFAVRLDFSVGDFGFRLRYIRLMNGPEALAAEARSIIRIHTS